MSSTGQTVWIDGRHQYTFFTENFIEWAKANSMKLNPAFLKNTVQPQQFTTVEYLDAEHPCYSPKLVAAIEAWQFAVSKHGGTQKTPTQNIEKWLFDNKSGLNFNHSKQTFESIARVSNFRSKSSSMTIEEMQEAKEKLKEYESRKSHKQSQKYIEEDPVPF